MTPERADEWAKGIVFAGQMLGIACMGAFVLVGIIIWLSGDCIYPFCVVH